eukprot:scaffold111488_cov19-Tisochrysis_lutea.AAC.3
MAPTCRESDEREFLCVWLKYADGWEFRRGTDWYLFWLEHEKVGKTGRGVSSPQPFTRSFHQESVLQRACYRAPEQDPTHYWHAQQSAAVRPYTFCAFSV